MKIQKNPQKPTSNDEDPKIIKNPLQNDEDPKNHQKPTSK